MTSPFVPSSFMYGDAPQGGALMPMIVAGRIPSDTIDKQYQSGYLWLSSLDFRNSDGTTGNGTAWIQAGNTAGTPNWTSLSSGAAGGVSTISDGSTQVLPIAGNIALVSTPNQVTVTSSAPSHELIFSIPSAFIAPGSIEATTSLEAIHQLTV